MRFLLYLKWFWQNIGHKNGISGNNFVSIIALNQKLIGDKYFRCYMIDIKNQGQLLFVAATLHWLSLCLLYNLNCSSLSRGVRVQQALINQILSDVYSCTYVINYLFVNIHTSILKCLYPKALSANTQSVS